MSRLGNIEHWAIANPPEKVFEEKMRRVRRVHDNHAPLWDSEVEVVPAAALRGAVSTLVRIAEMRSYQPGDAADQARQTLVLLGVKPFAAARGQ